MLSRKINKIIRTILILILFISFSYSQKQVYGYYPDWVESTLPVEEIDYKSLTHIIHAFIYPDENGFLVNANELAKSKIVEKAHSENVKVLVSLGGAPGNTVNPSEYFHTVASDETKLNNFVNQVMTFLTQNKYDGVDIDWEHPGTGEKESFTKIVKALREKIDKTNPDLILTMATFPSESFHKFFDYGAIINDIDYFLVMAYNYTGKWASKTSHSAPLFSGSATFGSVDATLRNLVDKYNIPKNKLVMGTSFIGWKLKETGLNKAYKKDSDKNSATTVLYKEIDILVKSGKYQYFWDNISKVPYIINVADSVVISYDDTISVRHKAEYVMDNDYAGLMIWALSYDYLTDKSQPLLKSIRNSFNYTSVNNDNSEVINGYKLMNNYPNPFNPSTKIEFEIPEKSFVKLSVYNLTGQEVSKIFKGNLEAGKYIKTFNASHLASGVYYYKLTSGKVALSKKMMLVK